MFSRFRKGDMPDVRRWAVLWDAYGEPAKPVGVAVEHPGHVHVYVPKGYNVPSRFDGPYRVLQPDGHMILYTPSSEGYFNQVLQELSRVFSIGKQDASPAMDNVGLLDVFMREVVAPRQALGFGEYEAGPRVAVGGSEPYRHDRAARGEHGSPLRRRRKARELAPVA
jgi:hypothetical protein